MATYSSTDSTWSSVSHHGSLRMTHETQSHVSVPRNSPKRVGVVIMGHSGSRSQEHETGESPHLDRIPLGP